jgi:hypothetical protein
MTTEINTVETETKPETVNVQSKPETRKPKNRKPKPETVELKSFKSLYNSATISIPKPLFDIFPETETLFRRLSSYGLSRFKFDFGFSTKTTGKRNVVIETRFFNLGNPATKNRKPLPSGLYVSANHQITGKTYYKLFPEIKNLFDRLSKTGANNFRLNISFAHVNSPQKIREHIIKTDSPETYLP